VFSQKAKNSVNKRVKVAVFLRAAGAPYLFSAFFAIRYIKMADEGELDTVKLISADGHEFVVDRKAAMVSGTIKSMLSGPGTSIILINVITFNVFWHAT
jgi:hypothetical protein